MHRCILYQSYKPVWVWVWRRYISNATGVIYTRAGTGIRSSAGAHYRTAAPWPNRSGEIVPVQKLVITRQSTVVAVTRILGLIQITINTAISSVIKVYKTSNKPTVNTTTTTTTLTATTSTTTSTTTTTLPLLLLLLLLLLLNYYYYYNYYSSYSY